MKIRLLGALILGCALGAATWAQDANPAPAAGQDSGYGHHGARGQYGGRGGMGFGRGVMGTVTEVAADHFTVKSFTGQSYTINFSANTRIFKQIAGERGQGWGRGNPPQEIKATDIKVGDAIEARGELDENAKSVGAVAIVQLDPERAKQMEAMEASYGKTWLMGKVTAIDGTKVTLMGPDQAAHSFVADENTDFRERRNPITLADIKVGDTVRAEGALKAGVFTATTVNDMGAPGEMPHVPHNAPPQQ